MKRQNAKKGQQNPPEQQQREVHANSYEHYIDPIPGYSRPDTELSGGIAPAHLYTLHLVRSVYNEEIF